jgi:hypothetical protein
MPENGKRNQKPPGKENVACGNRVAPTAQLIPSVSLGTEAAVAGCSFDNL